MKRILLLFIGISCCLYSFGQVKFTEAERDSLLQQVVSRLQLIEAKTMEPERFKLYKTENMYTFLKLDTATGQIEQLQWSLNDNAEGTVGIINDEKFSIIEEPGRFELYATNNMYQFILLDKAIGRTWHVQWGIGENKRWIKRMY